ncbi:MAG: tRNA 2-thiouridine(34) synthase MnmA [Deltaproteobacteria bacterium]|nr:tRNA 2-thiouridine(34) synthase MnmA [Deltaproteobacteria bacterium]
MKKVAVAMSGGVDSAVAAWLLKESGCEIVGVTMCLGVAPAAGGKAKCCGPREVEDARSVCRTLGIGHYVIDFAADLEEKVIRPFVDEYVRGRTPNPCVACNRSIKFGSLLARALSWGFEGIATGHYAAIAAEDGAYRLKTPKDRRKDQTYFLHAIPREALGKVLFPLAGYTKDEVRAIAAKAGLPVFDKPESQDICFIPAEGHGAFLQRRGVPIAAGEIVDRQGRVVGRHRGIACYTIGQRGGLGISAPKPVYVLAIDAAQNRLVVGPKEELKSDWLIADQVNCLVEGFPEEAWAKIRYAHRAARCRVDHHDGRLTIRFAEPQEAVAPGQSVVLYDGTTVLGGGIIQEVQVGNHR